uniref:Uncharacterized protein n=1 Tax=Pararge aegeria TaxID=116150 RepID=S4NIJ8_9NEOP
MLDRWSLDVKGWYFDCHQIAALVDAPTYWAETGIRKTLCPAMDIYPNILVKTYSNDIQICFHKHYLASRKLKVRRRSYGDLSKSMCSIP